MPDLSFEDCLEVLLMAMYESGVAAYDRGEAGWRYVVTLEDNNLAGGGGFQLEVVVPCNAQDTVGSTVTAILFVRGVYDGSNWRPLQTWHMGWRHPHIVLSEVMTVIDALRVLRFRGVPIKV